MRKRDGKLLFVMYHCKITKSPVIVSGNEPSLRGYPGAERVALIEPNVLAESHSHLKDRFSYFLPIRMTKTDENRDCVYLYGT